jgi:hypothetical protein
MAPFAPPTAPVQYDNLHNYANMSPLISIARIDAIDDYTQNMPGPSVYSLTPAPVNAIFDIVASTKSSVPPGISVVEYNNMTGVGTATDITAPVTTPAPGLTHQKNIVPVVACGPGSFYSIAYFSAGNYENYFATAIDWYTGTPFTDPNAYQVPTHPWAPSPGFPFGIALSGTCNTDLSGTQNLFAGWENAGSVWEKYTIPVAPYGFRHAATSVPTVVTTDEWQLYPNPACEHMTLTVPAGFVKDGTTFHITDLSGKTVLQQAISGASETINVSSLPSGMYLLNIYADGMNTKTIKFVKE